MRNQKENAMSMCGICKNEPSKPYQVGIYTDPSPPLAYTQRPRRLLRYSTQYVCDKCIAANRRKKMRRLKLWWIPVICMGLLLGLSLIRGNQGGFEVLLVIFVAGSGVLIVIDTITELRTSHTERGKNMAEDLTKSPRGRM